MIGQPGKTSLIKQTMPALDTTSGFAIYLLLVGVVLFLLLGLIAFFVKKFGRPAPVVHCPHCNCQGTVQGWGNYRCRICDHKFVINASGKVISSLKNPMLRQLAIWSPVFFVVIFCLHPHGKHDVAHDGLWVLYFLIWFVVFPVQRKSFPKD